MADNTQFLVGEMLEILKQQLKLLTLLASPQIRITKDSEDEAD